MRSSRTLAWLTLLAAVTATDRTPAQEQTASPRNASGTARDVVLILDCSGSMKEPTADGTSKMEAAKTAVTGLIEQIADGRRVALVIYGHDKEQACQAVKVVRKLSPLNDAGRADLAKAVAALQPVGSTPIALSLQTAAEQLSSDGDATLILISDGMETCKGDPAAVAAELAKRKNLSLGVVGFGVQDKERQALEAIAQAGNGTYRSAETAVELVQVAQQIAADEGEEPLPELFVFVTQRYSNDNPLHSEFLVNGKTVDVFTSNSQKSLGSLVKRGWNTVTIRTTPEVPANEANGLSFSIGPARQAEDSDKWVMQPVLWEFCNDTDWKFADRKYSHPLGKNVKQVELNYRIYYAGLKHEAAELQDGDYVLQGSASYSNNAPITATVFVNDVPLNSFLLQKRQVVITPLLKKGRNEIRIVSGQVRNAVADNDLNFEVGGPAVYNAVKMKYELSPVCQFKSMQGWGRDKRTGQLVNKAKSGAETVERVIPFHLDEDPNAEDRDPQAAAVQDGDLMVFVRQHYSNENPLHSEFRINDTLVNVFTSNTQQAIGRHLKPGWNTISIKTVPQVPANDANGLEFDIGPVRYDEDSDKLVMGPVLWSFRNETDWVHKESRYSHPLGPSTKEVEHTYRVYLADLEREQAPIDNGDYVLTGSASYSNNTPVMATVFVNGTPLSSFILGSRQVVITPLLKPGKNEIKLVSSRVKNCVSDNDLSFAVAGPAEYNAANMTYELKPIAQFKTFEGWERDKRTGQLVNRAAPDADTIERVIPFVLTNDE